jgi:HD-like signal output (HDOD) protein
MKSALRKRLEGLEQMPSIPVVLAPLLRYLEQPLDRLELQQVVDLISHDKSLAAQCLHMANSPLFGHWRTVDSVRNAVVALGMQRMRDIAVSCSVLTLLPQTKMAVDPVVFWEHSLGCALVCRQFAKKVGFADPGKAYLAGLLHDIGVVAHLWALPREFTVALQQGQTQHIPLHEAEMAILGFTHCETGKMVADSWHLPPELVAVVSCHHEPLTAVSDRTLVALVSLSDLLCRMAGLGYGYVEDRQINFVEEPGFAVLLQECPALQNLDWVRFTIELEAYMEEVRRLVTVLYRAQ